MDLAPGSKLAHYEILGPLGQGGMGQVFRARDEKLGREIALKLLPAELGNDERRLQRLEQEARSLAKLSHPNIVTIFSVEEWSGHRFITMEKIEGKTLDAHIDTNGLPIKKILEFAAPLTAAVAAAHDQRVVHRDLKPANVMIAADGTVKVLDFGLAKLSEAARDTPGEETKDSAETMTATSMPTPITDAGTVMGTAPYMSPEQARGEPVDHRSDIFSLGVMLYQMATGRLPFTGKTAADTVSSILRDTPVSVTELKPDLPNHLGRIVRRCLEKDPRTRLQSAGDLHQDLVGLRDELSGAIPAAPAAATPRGWLRAAWIGLVVVLGALAVWQGGWLDRSTGNDPAAVEAPGQKMIVVFPFENLGPAEDAYFAAGIAEEIGSRLASVASLGVISRASATQYDRAGKTMATVGTELGVDYVLDGTVRWDRSGDGPSRVRVTPQLIRVSDDQQLWSERYDETLEEIFAVQTRIAKEVLGELNFQLQAGVAGMTGDKPTDNLEAYQAYLRARENRLVGSYSPSHREQTIAYLETAVRLDPEFAAAWALLSEQQSYFYHLRYDTTQPRIDAARRAVDRALEIDPDLPQAYLALGLYHYRCFRDYERALAEFTIAARGLPNDSELLVSVAAVRRRLGEFRQAAEDAERAFKLNPNESNIAWDLAVTYGILGQFDKAIERADRAIEIAPADSPAYLVKSYFHVVLGDLGRAREVLEAMPETDTPFAQYAWLSQELFERDYAAARRRLENATWRSIDHTTAHHRRAQFLGDLNSRDGRRAEAEAQYREALAELDSELIERPDDSRRHMARALALASLGRVEEAVEAAEHAVELYPPSLDAFHGPHTVYGSALVYVRAGLHDRAIDIFEELLERPQHTVVSIPMLELDPEFDALRGHPRFQALLAGD